MASMQAPRMTSRQVKAAYRKSSGPRLTDVQLRQQERAAELRERAERIREQENKKRENKRKREEKEVKEKVKRQRMGIKEAAPEQLFKSSQLPLRKFFEIGKGTHTDVEKNFHATGRTEETAANLDSVVLARSPGRQPLQDGYPNFKPKIDPIVVKQSDDVEAWSIAEADLFELFPSNTQIEREISNSTALDISPVSKASQKNHLIMQQCNSDLPELPSFQSLFSSQDLELTEEDLKEIGIKNPVILASPAAFIQPSQTAAKRVQQEPIYDHSSMICDLGENWISTQELDGLDV